MVVVGTLGGIRKIFIGFRYFFEPIFSVLAVGIEIRMVFPCELPIGLFNILFRGSLRNSECFVVVAFSHRALSFIKATG
jgi:hypothetical protein